MRYNMYLVIVLVFLTIPFASNAMNPVNMTDSEIEKTIISYNNIIINYCSSEKVKNDYREILEDKTVQEVYNTLPLEILDQNYSDQLAYKLYQSPIFPKIRSFSVGTIAAILKPQLKQLHQDASSFIHQLPEELLDTIIEKISTNKDIAINFLLSLSIEKQKEREQKEQKAQEIRIAYWYAQAQEVENARKRAYINDLIQNGGNPCTIL